MNTNNKTSGRLDLWMPILLIIMVFVIGLGSYAVADAYTKPKVDDNATRVAVVEYESEMKKRAQAESFWRAPSMADLTEDAQGQQIRYGRELIANTSKFLGPKGTVAHLTNGMNCQNCHLDAGTKPWGNNYAGVAANFPKFRARSGSVESIDKRINDCMERSLNGSPLNTMSAEMQAMKAYIVWLGQGVAKGSTPKGTGIVSLPFLDRAADPTLGRNAYSQKCTTCHGQNGEGMKTLEQAAFLYPPLWGGESYNVGAGLYRLSRLAGYIKHNMPWGINSQNPTLTDEEAWDIAAYINSMPHPAKDLSNDWPDITKKPVDHPFGPFADGFSEQQHKFGPFGPIEAAKKTY